MTRPGNRLGACPLSSSEKMHGGGEKKSAAARKEQAATKEGEPETARIWWSARGMVIGAVVLSVLYSLLMIGIFGLKEGVAEGGPIEAAQILFWVFPATLAIGGACWVAKGVRPVLVFLGGMGLAAGAREADLHILMNPGTLGDWGVRYRLRWWMSTHDPILPRLMWLAIFLAIGVITVHVSRKALPVIWTKHRWMPRLLLMMIIAGALGWISDDILRPLQQYSSLPPAAEETFETISGLLFVMIMVRLRFDTGRPEL